MRKVLSFFLAACLSHGAFAAGDVGIALEKAPINPLDLESIQRGAHDFKESCMSCHALKYLKYDDIAREAGITPDKMPKEDQDWWFGTAPPDLTLTARSRGVDWIYTYLHAFYVDKSRKLNSNNLLVHNSSMPNVLAPLQGEQELLALPHEAALDVQPQWYDLLKLKKHGSLTPEQFDQRMADITNFLDYAAEPKKMERIKLGKWVLLFLVGFFILAWFLKHEFWRDVKNNRQLDDDEA